MSRQFLLLLILTVSVNTGMGIIIPVLPNLLKDFGFTTAALSIPFFVLVLARVIIKPYTGKALQWFTSRTLLIVSFSLYALVFFIYPKITSPEMFIAVRFFEGIVEGIAGVVLTDVAIALSGKVKNRGVLMGYFSASFGMGFILGPVIGGVAFSLYGKEGMFLSGAIIGLIGVVGAMFLVAMPKHKSSSAKGVIQVLSDLKGQALLLPYYSPNILRRALFFSFMMILPLYIHEELKLSNLAVGWYFTASAVITTLFMPLTGKLADRLNTGNLVMISLLIMGALIASFGLTTDVQVFSVIFLLETFAFAIMLPAGMKYFADLVQDHPQRGSILGNFGSLTELVTIVLALTVLPLYSYSPKLTWIILGGLCIVAAIPFFRKQETFNNILDVEVLKESKQDAS